MGTEEVLPQLLERLAQHIGPLPVDNRGAETLRQPAPHSLVVRRARPQAQAQPVADGAQLQLADRKLAADGVDMRLVHGGNPYCTRKPCRGSRVSRSKKI